MGPPSRARIVQRLRTIFSGRIEGSPTIGLCGLFREITGMTNAAYAANMTWAGVSPTQDPFEGFICWCAASPGPLGPTDTQGQVIFSASPPAGQGAEGPVQAVLS